MILIDQREHFFWSGGLIYWSFLESSSDRIHFFFQIILLAWVWIQLILKNIWIRISTFHLHQFETKFFSSHFVQICSVFQWLFLQEQTKFVSILFIFQTGLSHYLKKGVFLVGLFSLNFYCKKRSSLEDENESNKCCDEDGSLEWEGSGTSYRSRCRRRRRYWLTRDTTCRWLINSSKQSTISRTILTGSCIEIETKKATVITHRRKCGRSGWDRSWRRRGRITSRIVGTWSQPTVTESWWDDVPKGQI